MENKLQRQEPNKPGALALMASRLSVDPSKLLDTLKATCFKGASNEELLGLVVTANEYGLNPLLKELYAFPAKGGGIVPVVGVDGWVRIVNRRPDFDGVSFEFTIQEDGKPICCTAKMRVKGRALPVEVTEYFDECVRATEPWTKMPKRMLRHKAFIQCARLAFGFSGILDDDEASDFGQVLDVTPKPQAAEVVSQPKPGPIANAPEPDTSGMSVQDKLEVTMTEAGVSLDKLCAFAVELGHLESPAQRWVDIPDKAAAKLLAASKLIINQIGGVK